MMVFASKLDQVPIIALSSGGRIATTVRPVIDWTALKITALLCETANKSDLVLLAKDIRQYDAELILVNSEDDLIETSEVIRLQPLLKQDFRLIGATVKTELGLALGRVSDYSFDVKTLDIQQLYVKQSWLKNVLGGPLVINRLQVVDVTPPVITVRDATTKEPIVAPQPVALK